MQEFKKNIAISLELIKAFEQTEKDLEQINQEDRAVLDRKKSEKEGGEDRDGENFKLTPVRSTEELYEIVEVVGEASE